MTSVLSSLNLRPQERRLIVFVAIVVFVVLNIWLVWPHFGDWTMTQIRMERAQKTLSTYQGEIAKTKAYEVKLRQLESAGSSVVPEEQELDLVRTIDNQAHLAKLTFFGAIPTPKVSNTQTNRFFEEQYETLHVAADNEQLVNFLVSLTSTNSLIRVRDLSLKLADASGYKLDGNMNLVASYQKSKPTPVPPDTSRAPGKLATAAAKPAKPIPAPNASRTNRFSAGSITTHVTNKQAVPKARATNLPARK